MKTKASTIRPPWRLLDHTADIRMEVCGQSLEELFINAARGLASLLQCESHDTPSHSLTVDLQAGDREELLVAWLREILYHHHASGFSFGDAHIRDLSDKRIVADLVSGKTGADAKEDLEIKAVTYHGLAVEPTDDGFVARIVFDI